jgi:hypothetical protein
MSNGEVTHITFGMRGDGSLRAVLKRAGRRDRVVRLWDDLSLGPIDPPEPKARWAWAKRELGLFPYSQYLFVKRNNAWEAALSAPGRRIAWVSRRMPHEYCGFLEWLWRLGDAPCDVVDIHDVKFDWHLRDGTVRRQGVPCIGYIREEHIRDNAFWDLARPLTAARRRRYREDWRKLRAENAPFAGPERQHPRLGADFSLRRLDSFPHEAAVAPESGSGPRSVLRPGPASQSLPPSVSWAPTQARPGGRARGGGKYCSHTI